LSIASPVLVTRFAGADYTRAIPVLAIMAFYPLQQTFGQLNGTAFKAAGRTAEYRNISIALSIPDMLLTYWLIAPADAIVPGLDLGALGVAVRMVIYGLISVQVYEWRNAKYFDIPYARLLRDRLRVVGAVSAGGLALWTFNRVLVMTFRLDEGAALACGSLLYGTAAAWYLSRTVAAQSLRALIVGRRAAGTDRGN
jgi:O-antigen/teichoic acid export membrane protein